MRSAFKDASTFWFALLILACNGGAPVAAEGIPTIKGGHVFLPDDQIRRSYPDREIVTLTGVRVRMGNAVECPEIETEDGVRHKVSRLSGSVALGSQVTVRGYMGEAPHCNGFALVVLEERQDPS